MIVIYGASGHTGKLISAALKDLRLDFAMAGRDTRKLKEAAKGLCDDVRCASIRDTEQLLSIFRDADVVVNCAGPFGVLGEAVVRAALAADCHYIDTTGEQDFVRRIYEQFEAAARQAGRVVVNACAFEVALGDWAASVAASALTAPDSNSVVASEGVEIADSITIAYAIENMQPTQGTRLSILDAMGRPGYRWDEDRWTPVSPGSERLDVVYPAPFGSRSALSFPSPEVITVPRHTRTKRVQTFMSLGQETPLTRAAAVAMPMISPILSPLLGSLLRSSIGAIAESTIRSSEDLGDKSHDLTRFAIVAEARRGDRVERCTVSGSDIYRVSAGIACLAAERLENEGEMAGVLAPSELFPPTLALEEITQQHGLRLVLPRFPTSKSFKNTATCSEDSDHSAHS